MKHDPGIGATDGLSLRVSVATLVRVLFENPENGELMLALERKATLYETKVEVQSQPLGGAIRILDINAIHNLIEDFHFDSERSLSEQDFRIFIQPADWPAVREFCIQHLSIVDDLILETDPVRELTEEFGDALKINLKPEQYTYKPLGTVIENEAIPTNNIHAKGVPTVRIYRIFEVTILDATLIDLILKNSGNVSNEELSKLALMDLKKDGKGRANALLTLPLKRLAAAYLGMSPDEHNLPILFENNRLDETVTAVLDGIDVPKYQRV